ncbi:MAG: PIN domain-containing protein [Caldilinea sp.]
MIRVFVDASVLFAACYSASGESREIVRLAIQGEITLIISGVAQEEVRRNLTAKAPKASSFLDQLLELVPFEIVEATKQEVLNAQAYTELKDAPIVAAAIQAQTDYLVSLDRVHLVEVPEVAEGSGLAIVLPSTLLKIIGGRAT